MASTAHGAIAAANDGGIAAISSALAKEVYSLVAVASNIEDRSNNITRFLVIGKMLTKPCGDDKTSLVFSAKDKPGVLFQMLQPFAKSRINLSKIESRPIKNKPWEYLFFLDLMGHREQAAVKKAIAELEKNCVISKSHGFLREWPMKIVEQLPEYIRSLIPYEPGKPIEEVEREYGIANSTKLASNENPLGPSPKALAAIRAKLAELNLYPDGDCFYLKNGLAKKLGVAPDELIFGNGSNEIIELAVRAFMRTGRSGGDGAPGVRGLPADRSSGGRQERTSGAARLHP